MIIFVKDSRNKILYPTHKKDWADKLVKKGKAKWIKHKVICLQLNYPVLDEPRDKQSYFVIGMDSGYKNIGYKLVKITNGVAKILIGGTFLLRTEEISELLGQRKMYRKLKRGHARDNKNSNKRRIPRWKNRSKTRMRMNPTIRHLIHSHLRVIEILTKLVPEDKISINLEYAKFDIQKISETKSPEGQGYDNVKNYVRTRDSYTCQSCGKTNCVIEVHHKHQRKDGGTNSPANLISLCTKCHKDHHDGKINVNGIKPKQFRDAGVLNTAMPSIYKELAKKYPVYKFYGYETSAGRAALPLDKTHENDALSLSLFGIDLSSIIDYNLHKDYTQFRRHNRKRAASYHDRTYYITKYTTVLKTIAFKDRVANNRNRRTDQPKNKISLMEFRKANPNVQVYATPGKVVHRRAYSDVLYRPGDLVRDLDGKIHIVKGWASTQLLISTTDDDQLKCKFISKVKHNTGLI